MNCPTCANHIQDAVVLAAAASISGKRARARKSPKARREQAAKAARARWAKERKSDG